MEEKRNLKGLIAVCLLVLALVLITVGTTFAFFQYSRQGTTENTLHTGTLTFVYDETKSKDGGVSIENAFPMSDGKGQTLTKGDNGVFDFDIIAKTQGAPIYYEIYLTKDNNSTLPEYAVKTYLTEVTGENIESGVSNLFTSEAINLYSELGESKVPSMLKQEVIGKTLYQGSVSEEEITKTFRYRMWIDNDANQVRGGEWIHNNKTFSVKVNVYAQNNSIPGPTDQTEICNDSNVNEPKLVDGMIPVYYDYEEGTWKKANANTANWYNYCNQEWANAVTVSENGSSSGHNREYYQKASAGEVISVDDINTMWVWIPRYEYNYVSIKNAGGDKSNCTNSVASNYECYLNPGEIKIKFINGTSNTQSDDYIVHPAFNFGDDKLTGLWFAKFDTSNQEGIYEDSTNAKANNSELTPIIKPNVGSWRYVTISNSFYAARNMQEKKYDTYGFKNDLASYDTHMSKNSEWSSVAYLSQSKYGKYGNDTYGVNEKEVYINNCSQHITGIAGNTASAGQSNTCTNTYDTIQGQKASTTGNITGVYDMSGGAWERVMGVLDNGSGKPTIASSGFTDNGKTNPIPDKKYYDLYSGDDVTKACNGTICYGHAFPETLGWYGDYYNDLDSENPWFNRGGTYSDGASTGVFGFLSTHGGIGFLSSFRIVLAPIET